MGLIKQSRQNARAKYAAFYGLKQCTSQKCDRILLKTFALTIHFEISKEEEWTAEKKSSKYPR
jgi:hypothetical protein